MKIRIRADGKTETYMNIMSIFDAGYASYVTLTASLVNGEDAVYTVHAEPCPEEEYEGEVLHKSTSMDLAESFYKNRIAHQEMVYALIRAQHPLDLNDL